MDAIVKQLEAEGMDPDEIKAKVSGMFGAKPEESKRDEDTGAAFLSAVSNQQQQQEQEMLKVEDIELGNVNATLEYDETNMKDTPRTEKGFFNVKGIKDNMTDFSKRRNRSPGSDGRLHKSSEVDRRPKMKARKKTGMHDSDSMKLGSVDEEEAAEGDSSDVNSSKESHQRREALEITRNRNSLAVPKVKMDQNKGGPKIDEESDLHDMEDESFSEDDFSIEEEPEESEDPIESEGQNEIRAVQAGLGGATGGAAEAVEEGEIDLSLDDEPSAGNKISINDQLTGKEKMTEREKH
mmetsp:Transcript_24266/g.37420  ORF Transcript_24266/g.37420 Transcript_24266/m.37420 type:complete len:295 (+) Transcript_24266:2073-2957(+)